MLIDGMRLYDGSTSETQYGTLQQRQQYHTRGLWAIETTDIIRLDMAIVNEAGSHFMRVQY